MEQLINPEKRSLAHSLRRTACTRDPSGWKEIKAKVNFEQRLARRKSFQTTGKNKRGATDRQSLGRPKLSCKEIAQSWTTSGNKFGGKTKRNGSTGACGGQLRDGSLNWHESVSLFGLPIWPCLHHSCRFPFAHLRPFSEFPFGENLPKHHTTPPLAPPAKQSFSQHTTGTRNNNNNYYYYRRHPTETAATILDVVVAADSWHPRELLVLIFHSIRVVSI